MIRKLAMAGLITSAAAGCSSAREEVGSNDLAVTVCGQTSIKGVDVYHGDNGGNAINWSSVKSAGISFAFAKATESTNFTDPMFATNWAGMKNAGLVRGAYHFFHADVDPVTQANFFLGVVGTVSSSDLLVLDLETTNGETESKIVANATTFLSTVESKVGFKPILYMSSLFLSTYGSLGSYPLWVANYGVSCPNVPSAWSTYAFWQSTSSGTVASISGSVDLDSFNGTLTQLLALNGTPSFDAGVDAAIDVDASDASDASDAGPITSEPQPDGAAPHHDAAAGDAAPDANGDSWQTNGGCAMHSASRTTAGDFAIVAAIIVVASRRRRRFSTNELDERGAPN